MPAVYVICLQKDRGYVREWLLPAVAAMGFDRLVTTVDEELEAALLAREHRLVPKADLDGVVPKLALFVSGGGADPDDRRERGGQDDTASDSIHVLTSS